MFGFLNFKFSAESNLKFAATEYQKNKSKLNLNRLRPARDLQVEFTGLQAQAARRRGDRAGPGSGFKLNSQACTARRRGARAGPGSGR